MAADKQPVLHFQLELAPVNSSIEVPGAISRLSSQTSTVQTMVSEQEIAQTPGADQTNSLAMITDYTPGAYMVHDMLHMRGGHQVNWFFDGIPVINTNIAANVAPLINPKNVQELEVERGGYSSEYGDRTYGFFNQNIVSEYTHQDAVTDGVNVGFNIFIIDTQVSQNGGRIWQGEYIEHRERLTRRKRWELGQVQGKPSFSDVQSDWRCFI